MCVDVEVVEEGSVVEVVKEGDKVVDVDVGDTGDGTRAVLIAKHEDLPRRSATLSYFLPLLPFPLSFFHL